MILPDKFVENMNKLLGTEADTFFDALKKDAVKAMTVDHNKINYEVFQADCGLAMTSVEGVENGYYYEGKVGSNIYHHAGVIYSQDASAMFPVEALGVEKNDIVLDLCSAPGGKSVQILEKLQSSGLLVSNEYVYNRAKILYDNLTRFGYDNYVITNNSPIDFDKKVECFDKILVDAPCSGEGMFRRDDVDTYHWNEKNVETCAVRQLEILQSVAKLLKKGGTLVYSTCTYNEFENESVVVEFLKRNKDYILCNLPKNVRDNTDRGIIIDKDFDTTKTGRRYPHKFRGEGQFVACMKRLGEDDISYSDDIITDKYYELGRKDRQVLEKELKPVVNISALRLYKKGDNIYVAPNVDFDYRGLNVVSLGVCMGQMDKSGIKLNHAFYKAYSSHFNNIVELNKSQAETYLTGNVVDNVVASDGIAVVTYKGIALGGCKIIKGVLKNYYPKELRNK